MTTRRQAVAAERQQQILDAIRSHVAAHGYPPSVRELGEAVGLSSPSTVVHHLQVLADKGLIRRVPGRSRAVVIEETP